MTATTTAERGRTRPLEGRPRRELPVLFHLLDVSRGHPAGPAPASPHEPPAEQMEPASDPPAAIDELLAATPAPKPQAVWLPAESQEEPSCSKRTDLPLEACENQTEDAATSEPAKLPVRGVPGESGLAAESKAENERQLPPAVETTPVAGQADTLAAPVTSASRPPSASLAQAPPRTQEPRRHRRLPAQDPWLTTHGKYIAIGFVLALLGTIYLARVNRSSALASKDLTPAADVAEAAPTIDIPPLSVASQAKPAERAAVASGTSELSPARIPNAAPAGSQASLHPPTIPQLQSPPAGGTASGDASLFPWATAEERVAARPTAQATIENHTLPGANSGAGSQAASDPAMARPAAPTAVPSIAPPLPAAPAYPNTGYPTEIPAPSPRPSPAPPTSMYGGPAPGASQFPAPTGHAYPHSYPQQPSPAWNPTAPAYGAPSAAPPAAGTVPQYPLPDNSARGARYERTGSGLY